MRQGTDGDTGRVPLPCVQCALLGYTACPGTGNWAGKQCPLVERRQELTETNFWNFTFPPHKYLQPMLTHQQVLAVWCWLLRYKEAFFGDMLSTAVCEPRGNSMKWMLPTRKNSSTSRLKSHSSHSKTECNFQPCFLTCTDQRSIHAVLTLNQFLPIPWHQLATV